MLLTSNLFPLTCFSIAAVLNTIAGFYNAGDATALQARAYELRGRFLQLEAALGEGPFFAGERFCVVDAVFGPVFRYFDVFDCIADFGILNATPRVRAWRSALAARESVRDAVAPAYPQLLERFLVKRNSALSGLIHQKEHS